MVVKRDGWKTLEEKWEEKCFWNLFGWVGRKENKWWGPSVFFLDPPNCFLPKIERKLSGDEFFLNWQKCSCASTHGLLQVAFIYFLLSFFCYFLFFFFFFFFFSRVKAWYIYEEPSRLTKMLMCICTWASSSCLYFSSSPLGSNFALLPFFLFLFPSFGQ